MTIHYVTTWIQSQTLSPLKTWKKHIWFLLKLISNHIMVATSSFPKRKHRANQVKETGRRWPRGRICLKSACPCVPEPVLKKHAFDESRRRESSTLCFLYACLKWHSMACHACLKPCVSRFHTKKNVNKKSRFGNNFFIDLLLQLM